MTIRQNQILCLFFTRCLGRFISPFGSCSAYSLQSVFIQLYSVRTSQLKTSCSFHNSFQSAVPACGAEAPQIKGKHAFTFRADKRLIIIGSHYFITDMDTAIRAFQIRNNDDVRFRFDDNISCCYRPVILRRLVFRFDKLNDQLATPSMNSEASCCSK